MPITTLIADDHALVREGLRSLLAAHANIDVVGFAANGREAVREALRLRPEVVLMDISMPELNGIDATRQLLDRHPAAKVIILSMHATIEHYYRAVRAGARARFSSWSRKATAAPRSAPSSASRRSPSTPTAAA